MAKKITVEVAVGSIWQEDVNYMTRFVKVESLSEKISAKDGKSEPCALVIRCNETRAPIGAIKQTTIAIRRFGKAGGFKKPGECRPLR